MAKDNYIPRGMFFTAKVVRMRAAKTAVVEREIVHFVRKYERFKKVRSRLAVHIPDGISVKEGDMVRVGETRKISKTKNFIIVDVLGGKK